ncbi:unnamed protein product [Echinostoma caproni]|uniref:AMP-binding domain-containing protein n=1 Tax=Echinostoma caproni TaxID=27848 RepID=A0A183AWY6_9TREM|nr:unnamed protein product [Echinostoma caproni]
MRLSPSGLHSRKKIYSLSICPFTFLILIPAIIVVAFISDFTCRLGADVRFRRIGKETIYTGDHIPLVATDELELPDVVVASIGDDVTKRTLLIYGHVDVKPVYEGEKWTHDPFDMQVHGDYLSGRGVTDDKGPLLGWLNAVEAFVVCVYGTYDFRGVGANIKLYLDSLKLALHGKVCCTSLFRLSRYAQCVGTPRDNIWLRMCHSRLDILYILYTIYIYYTGYKKNKSAEWRGNKIDYARIVQ